jgi:Peptidase S24-like
VTFSRRTRLVGVGLAVAVTGAAAGWVLGRVRAVGISGPSMVPALRDGDAVLAYPTHRPRPGAVVIARFRSRPDLVVVKRAIRPAAGGWWLEGDNPLVADDSRRYGPADVLGHVVCRYWPPRRSHRGTLRVAVRRAGSGRVNAAVTRLAARFGGRSFGRP